MNTLGKKYIERKLIHQIISTLQDKKIVEGEIKVKYPNTPEQKKQKSIIAESIKLMGEVQKKESELNEYRKKNRILEQQGSQLREEIKYLSESLQRSLYKKIENKSESYDVLSIESMFGSATNMSRKRTIDFRNILDGKNWHAPEKDGRWAGPGKTSTVRIPSISKGKHCIELLIVDTMSDNITDNLHCRLFGSREIDSKMIGFAKFQNLHKSKFPLKYILLFELYDEYVDDMYLEINCPETIAPASFGRSDMRSLSVRISHLNIMSSRS